MSVKENERDRWNRRYRAGSHTPLVPDPFLLTAFHDYIEPLLPHGGSALDVAGGAGRHAIWLAQRGWRVTLVDISDVGIGRARTNAKRLADRIEFEVAYMKKFKARRQRYDVVMVFFYLERGIFPELVKALRPGGLLVYKTYRSEQSKLKGGPKCPRHLLKENELLQAFRGLRVLYYAETARERAVAEFIGRKR